MVYIQSDASRKFPHHFDCACALYGALDDGLRYRLTSFEEVEVGRLDKLIKDHLFVGSVEFMREVFSRVNIQDARVPENSNRECEIITLKEALSRPEKLFIKPVEIKLFTGLVLDGVQHSCLDGLPEYTEVFAYKPFEFPLESEWRVYVLNHEIIYSANYSGYWEVSPKYDYVEGIIKGNIRKKFPRAYTIDVGILSNGENVVIEYNDMWAIGNYGLPNHLYIRALKERYFQIIKS